MSTSTSTSTSVTSTSTTTTLQSGCFLDLGDDTIRDTCRGLQWEKKTATGANPTELHRESNSYTWAGRCTLPNPGDLTANPLCQPNQQAADTCTALTGGELGCSLCAEGTCNVNPDDGPNTVTTIWDWLNQVNASSLGGHADWRIPTLNAHGDAAELETILLGWPSPSCPAGGIPCVDPIFEPTAAGPYWSASADGGPDARYLNFNTGLIDSPFLFFKDASALVRAVRTLTP